MNGKIYWEQQGVDRLCGVHCINTLLQGPFFNEVSLAQIALDLDKKEHSLMIENGMTKQYLKYMQEESGNVANDGYYSYQVLEEALRGIHLAMVSIDLIKSEELNDKIGLICNSSDHWFTLRKIDKVWYNLNSTNRRMPEIISDFYLSAFLIAVKNSGYQIFSVEGSYPESSEDKFEFYNKNQFWIQKKRIQKYHDKCIKRKGFKPNISGAGADNQMDKAIAASLGKKYQKYVSSGEDSDWDEDDKNKKKVIKQFGGLGAYIGDEVYVNYDKFHFAQQEVEMLTFMKQSLEQQYLHEPKQGKLVTIRHANGKKQQRLFEYEALIQALYDYIWIHRNTRLKFYLTNNSNKEKLVDVTIPLFALEDQDGDISIIVNDQ